MESLLGKTVRLLNPEPNELDARYKIIEDDPESDRVLAKFICDLPLAPVECIRKAEVVVVE